MLPNVTNISKIRLTHARFFIFKTMHALARKHARCQVKNNARISQKTRTDDEFRTLELVKERFKRTPRREREKREVPQRRHGQNIDQDWGSIWPVARTFHPATVPLPIRQGYPATSQPIPDKYGNAELMKIPNFLHLTPPVIERQCLALKKFCTPWPAGLETREKQIINFPLTLSTSSYLHSSPSIRDPRARVVTMKVPVDALNLDKHALNKLLRLVVDRYDPKTGLLTLVADRCPLSNQNQEYLQYLLTVLVNESKKSGPFSHEENDLFENRVFSWSKVQTDTTQRRLNEVRGEAMSSEFVQEYEKVVTEIHNSGEDDYTISQYRDAVLKLYGL
ncbi:unnamed protein product, partial [Meganyctiphanes norvegica]